jgi:long-subunit fatty acid transport protein
LETKKFLRLRRFAVLTIVAAAPSLTAHATDLSYTYLDFQSLDNKIDKTAQQSPLPGQTVTIQTSGGNGIAAAGSYAFGDRWYFGGYYRSSVIDYSGVVKSPIATDQATGTFDLVASNLALGYVHKFGDQLDFTADIDYERSFYDFGSIGGENFDLKDSGVGARAGLRWNPRKPFELFVTAHYSPVAKADLSQHKYESGTSVAAGVRWYFFQNLGLGVEHESGDVEVTTISMRFSFGNLPL